MILAWACPLNMSEYVQLKFMQWYMVIRGNIIANDNIFYELDLHT